MNLAKDLATYAKPEDRILNVVVEITRGSQNKVEYREDKGYFELDRVLHHQMFYDFDYGFLPQTLEGDGDPCDVILLCSEPTFPGCVVKSRVIGMIQTADQDGPDAKIICVPIGKIDPRRNHVKTLDDLNPHVREELLIFFKEYKRLEKEKYDKIIIEGFKTIDETYALINQSIDRYNSEHH
jgi:inorganic pyrophosphatase